MSMNPPSTVVGVFRDKAMAKQAMNALSDAGFSRDQVRYASQGAGGGFFEDIKSLFAAPGATADNLAHDLTSMGLSNDEARYYADEYNGGRTIIAVKAPGREQEAMDVLRRHGAYNYGPKSTAGAAANAAYGPGPTNAYVQQQPVNAPQDNYPPRQPVQTDSDRPLTPDNQPVVDNRQVQGRVVTEASSPPDTATAVRDTETGRGTELEQLQAQIQETRRQLEDARSQLQAAKDRESQLQSARQELQQAQAELQATLAELHETQSRVG